ncbi:MAG: hypothetical protein MUE53_02835 [Chitinophagales bacterium]|jgi:hypothetical protein|nr:hypothetical protein [Chitinophagales bacterium]
MSEKRTIESKALQINLDPKFYGTLAEIGAGQEVARNFFRAGGASGTIAKTMSAYDMTFSNAIYGEEADGRYVSKSRLYKMLDHEYDLLLERLGQSDEKRYFSFANTVASLNYRKNNQPHGWLGVKFQDKPGAEASNATIHVKLLDSDASLQYHVLGILGVNLIYACYAYYDDPDTFLNSLMDNMPINSIEIDMMRLKGPAFGDLDQRLIALALVSKGYSQVACFLPNGDIVQPKDFLYKKNICILRARFKPFTNLNMDIIEQGRKLFIEHNALEEKQVETICEITLKNLSLNEKISYQDFLDRAEMICNIGYPVLVTNFPEHHELTIFLKEVKPLCIGILLGVMNLKQIFDIRNYENPISDLLLQFGHLFNQKVKLYAYPFQPKGQNEIYTSKTLPLDSHMKHLYNFLLENNLIVDYIHYDKNNLLIDSNAIIEMIRTDSGNWEAYVPKVVSELIKEKCLFDHPCDIEKKRKIQPEIFRT